VALGHSEFFIGELSPKTTLSVLEVGYSYIIKKWAKIWMKLSKSSKKNSSNSQYLDESAL